MIIDDDRVRALLAEYDPRCRLVRIARSPAGLANQVHFVTTTRQDLVLKVFADDAGRWKSQKERAIYGHMRSIGIPAPKVCRIDTSKHVVPFIYSLTGRSPGEPLARVFSSLSDTEQARIYASLGDYLGTLPSTTFAQFGDVSSSADGLDVSPVHEWEPDAHGARVGPFASWRDMHTQTVSARLRFLERTIFADLIPAVERYLAVHRDLIDYAVVPRLLHMDLHPGNVVISEGKVSAILDVGEAVVGHNEYDLMRTELANFRGRAPIFAKSFMEAYEMHVSLDEGYSLRRDFYDVSRTLVWMKCLILYGDKYTHALASQSHESARLHLLSLTDNG